MDNLLFSLKWVVLIKDQEYNKKKIIGYYYKSRATYLKIENVFILFDYCCM